MLRREFLSRTTQGVSVLTLANLPLSFSNDESWNEDGILGQGDWRYRQVKDWGVQDKKKVPVRNLHEIVQDSQKNIYVLGDHAKNNILVYRPDGTLVKTLLKGISSGHGLSISTENNQEFLWVTNANNAKGFVRKYDLTGNLVKELTRPDHKLYSGGGKFLPTEVEVNPDNGDVYVADGYGSNLLSRFDKQGKLIDIYGADKDGKPFRCMHGVRIDRRDSKNPRLWVTSRKDEEIRVMTLDGKVTDIIRMPGGGPCRVTFFNKFAFIPVIWTGGFGPKATHSGFVLVLSPDNRPVSMNGGIKGKKDGKFLADRSQPSPFIFPHDSYVDEDGDLYVAQWNSSQTYPIKLQRVK